MRFIDEAYIYVESGKGGDGCLSFRREKYIPRGGPNGGDGGDGGSVYLATDSHLNTLIDFRYKRRFEAQHGERGGGNQCSGKKGDDLVVSVPVGTLVYDADTEELIADLIDSEQKVCVAQGGRHGLGNTHFKSSTNRAPRRITKGTPGELRKLKLELKLLADVGLLGLPNAGKSTFIRAISAATPKVADYPFTTLHPHLGVVRIGVAQSFVVADIPGLVEGASQGAGLGLQFLRHISRTRLLLHIVDLNSEDPAQDIRVIEHEIEQYSAELFERERWLVFNKIDSVEDPEKKARAILKKLKWKKPYFSISALTRLHTQDVVNKMAEALFT